MRFSKRSQAKCTSLAASGRIAFSVLLLALGSMAASAAEPGEPSLGSEHQESAGAVGLPAVAPAPAAASGLQVAIDPATGELRAPTAAEAKALAAGMSPMLKDAGQPVVWPDGTVTVDLNESFMQFYVATVGADGTLTMGCVDDPAATDLPVAATAAPAPLEEK